ncbi:MAG: YfcE family phosphodiesterase [Armatimonadia bacterium]|nr:YfcE family phosphodiesterase [Armatimonadia bacterium]
MTSRRVTPRARTLRIGVISDTHIPSRTRRLPEKVVETFSGTDLIIHAGDAVERGVIERLEEIAPTVVVEGNCERFAAPKTRVVQTPCHAVGVAHHPPRRLDAAFLTELFGEPVDAVISGHTHRSSINWMDGILFMNPGSPMFPRDGFRSVILLEAGDELLPEIRILGEAGGGD